MTPGPRGGRLNTEPRGPGGLPLVLHLSGVVMQRFLHATIGVRNVSNPEDFIAETCPEAMLQEECRALRKDAERYRLLASRLLAADFDYTGERIQALVFEMPEGFQASADCNATIDAAMVRAPAVGAA